MLQTFDQIAADGRDVSIDADVVVVGSGAGGGAIAAELAEGGRSVVVSRKAATTRPRTSASTRRR